MHHYTERVTHLQHQPSGHLAEVAWPGEGGEREGCAGLGAVCPPLPAPSAQVRKKRRRASGRVFPCKAGSSAGTPPVPARLSRGQIRDLREGSGRPQGPSRPTFPDSLGSMAPLSVARADPATASRPSPPPAARPEEAAAATTLGITALGGEGSPAGKERVPLPRLGGGSVPGAWRGAQLGLGSR